MNRPLQCRRSSRYLNVRSPRRPGTYRKPRQVSYRSRHTLLSRGEMAFFRCLQTAVGGRWFIMCKVRLADLITCPRTEWGRGGGAPISQKHIDFVLCDRAATSLSLAIELDDRSHDRPQRRRRDDFVNHALAQAGIPLLRFAARAVYCQHTIRAEIDFTIANPTA